MRRKLRDESKIQPKRYIVWSKKEINISDLWQRKWYIQQILTHGRAEDIAALDWNEVETFLPELNLPDDVLRLWQEYFKYVNG